MFNSAFNAFLPEDKKAINFYPESLQKEIDDWNTPIYDNVNNGVYKSGFASTQEACKFLIVPPSQNIPLTPPRFLHRWKSCLRCLHLVGQDWSPSGHNRLLGGKHPDRSWHSFVDNCHSVSAHTTTCSCTWEAHLLLLLALTPSTLATSNVTSKVLKRITPTFWNGPVGSTRRQA